MQENAAIAFIYDWNQAIFSLHRRPIEQNAKKLKNGISQGLVLAPTPFKIYLSDMPSTEANKFRYADDWAIACQSWHYKNTETNLTKEVNVIDNFFNKWYLKMNKTKTVSTVFHLDNHHANQALNIKIRNKQLHPEPSSKYVGVTLDRSLTYKKLNEKVA